MKHFLGLNLIIAALLCVAAAAFGANTEKETKHIPISGHEMLQYQGPNADGTTTQITVNAGTKSPIQYMRDTIPPFRIPPYAGQRYKARVPDTLDLAERCRLAIKNMTSLADPKLDYDTFFGGGTTHCFSDICGVKFQEAVPLMRIASGSTESLHVDRGWMTAQLRSIGPDGLFYIQRPYLPDENMATWVTSIATANGIVPLKGHKLGPFVETVVQGRMLGVFSIYYLRDRNPMWIETLNKMVDGIGKLTLEKDGYAYMPVRGYEPGAKLPPDAPVPFDMWAEELGGRFIQGLAQYYRISHYEPARKLNEKLVEYMRRHSHYFDEQGRFTQTGGPDGKPVIEGGHFHGHAIVLLNFIDHAMATGDRELLEYVKKSYEWTKANTYSSTVMGWFPELIRPSRDWSEPCCTADMVALAIKLSEAGAGDYWDEADRWVRNQLVEAQTGGGWGPGCCTGNAARAVYYAWKAILDFNDGRLRVNMLLNRASRWADIDSYIPYEGRVDIRVKQRCKEVLVRAPEWVKPGKDVVACKVDGKTRKFRWDSRYLNLGAAKPGQTLTLTFPIHERTIEKERLGGIDYKLVLRGNEVVSMSPRGKADYMPPYEREFYRGPVRWREVERFAPEHEIQW